MNDRWKKILFVALLTASTAWLAVLSTPNDELSIIACDVGEGDAFLIIHKNDQILIDGGPSDKVVECIDENLPFWDRKIELMILSHPQIDHFGGLIEVLKKYSVGTFLTSGLDASSQSFDLLKSMVGGSDTRVVYATSGKNIRLGLIYLDILHPSKKFISANSSLENFSGQEPADNKKALDTENKSDVLGAFSSSRDANDFSVVVLLSYRNFDALFTGDINPEISDLISENLKASGTYSIEYLKVPHHGSKNGLSKKLLDVVDPDVAVISVGKNNRYYHPDDEIIKMLKDKDIKILRTDQMGDVEVDTDGTEFWNVQ